MVFYNLQKQNCIFIEMYAKISQMKFKIFKIEIFEIQKHGNVLQVGISITPAHMERCILKLIIRLTAADITICMDAKLLQGDQMAQKCGNNSFKICDVEGCRIIVLNNFEANVVTTPVWQGGDWKRVHLPFQTTLRAKMGSSIIINALSYGHFRPKMAKASVILTFE